MVVLFVIATVLTFIIIDYVVQHRQAQLALAGAPAVRQRTLFTSAEDLLLPDGIFSTNGHLWSELSHHGSLKVGIDPFLLNAIGKVDQIHLPEKGKKIEKGDELFALQSGDRKIRVRAPFSGIVEKTSNAIENSPSTNIRELWSVRIKPENLADTITSFRVGHVAREWMKNEINHFRDFLSSFANDPHLALTMQDGGLPLAGSLSTLNENAWTKFETEFLYVEK